MGKKKKKSISARDKPISKSSVVFAGGAAWEELACSGYTRLSDNPEVITAVDTIARLIGSMTIHLMENSENGDIRVRNELSRKIDINPYSKSTRSNFIYWIVRTMILEGRGNTVVWPETSSGILRDLKPIPPGLVSFIPVGLWDYRIMAGGVEYDPGEVLHFVLNPDDYYPWKGTGYHIALSDVANNLKQAAETEKGFMKSKWKPSIIVKIDALTADFASKEGRKKLMENYIETSEAGEPWMVPAGQIDIEQVKPLTLADLALADFVTLDKKTVAAVLGVPPFVLGVGDFKRDEWNNFINTKIMQTAKVIEQEMTKKLIYGNTWFFRFNSRSLYNYDLNELAAVADDQYVRGIMTGNEVRDWLNLSPMEGLNDLVILENYIPRGMIGDQNKLNGGESSGT